MNVQQSKTAIIEFIKVNKIYPPDVIALRDVSLAIKPGEIVFLTGMSGAGKTTLLKLICAMEQPTKGLIEVAGHDLGRISLKNMQLVRQKIGMAYQDFKLLPKLTVYQNIAMPMEITFTPPKTIRDRINYLLDTLNLHGKADIKPDKLSRGEQQRVAIARAAANYPPILLADEPTGNLDRENSDLVIKLFAQLNRAGTTLIIATHDPVLYKSYPAQTLELSQGQFVFKDQATPKTATGE
ncbi:MAG: cell division ATP-binding protein FtsE [Deltaproteobacteria bacterium]|nr:cell division ATP-binding protein FtsE [Deltaproteobacteria bacterium]